MTKINAYLIGQRVTRNDVRGTVMEINMDRHTITVIWDNQTKATQYNASDFPAIIPFSIQQMIDEVRANKFNKSERTTSESMFYAIKGNQIYLILRDANYPFDLQKKLAFYQKLGYQTHVI